MAPLPEAAVAEAIEAARAAPHGTWNFVAAAEFLDGEISQVVDATRQYDVAAELSHLAVDIRVTDATPTGGAQLPDPFGELITEIVRAGDETLVRLVGPAASDDAWYRLASDETLDDLVASEYLFVDPSGERLPLVGLLEAAMIGPGVTEGDRVTYLVRLAGQVVLDRLQEAPALVDWLPDDLHPGVAETEATGSVVLENGMISSVEIDLSPTVATIAAGVDDEFDRRFYQSADVGLRAAFDLGTLPTIEVPDPSTVVPVAVPLGEVASDDLVVGECLAPGSDLRLAMLAVVSCQDAHGFEVYVVEEGWSQDEPYPGREAIRARADEVCIPAFADYVGISFEDSIHSLARITPLQEGWEDSGDRTIICLIEAYLPVRGVLAGAGQ